MGSRDIAMVSVVLVLLIGIASAQVPDPDMGWWKFDEGSSDLAADSSGNGHDGAILDGTWIEGG